MSSIEHSTDFSPLLGALKQIQFTLEANLSTQVMVATQTAQEFKRQKLPTHCTVKHRKIHGPRVPVQMRGKQRGYFNTLANWPNDGLAESINPTWYFVVNGDADIRLCDYVVHCRAGDIMLIPGHTPKIDSTRPHYEKITPDAACDILMIRIGPSEFSGVSLNLCHSRGAEHYHASEGEGCWIKHNLLASTIITLTEELLNQGNSSGANKSTFHFLLGTVLLIQQEIEQGRAFTAWRFPAESPNSNKLDPIAHATEYMHNHIDRALSIDQVARWVGLSRTVFVRMFREETGETFHAHLTDLRMERARGYLLNSNVSIEHVSSLVGLTAGQLRNLFRQRYRCGPREFRRTYKND